jgi:hypothetical protein
MTCMIQTCCVASFLSLQCHRPFAIQLWVDKDREFRHFSHGILGNSSADVSTEDSDSDMPTQGDHTLVMNGGMRIEDGGIVDLPEVPFKTSDPHYSWAQAKTDADRERAEEQAFLAEFGWMTDADHCWMGHWHHPVPL